MGIPYKDREIVPGARENDLGGWMPVVFVQSSPAGQNRFWEPKTIVAERYKTRDEAERRSVELAKQMIDGGKLR